MRRYEMPVFIINGFLDSGKTSFIKNVIDQKQFSEFKKILLLLCEEGEVEYEENFLKRNGVTVAAVAEDEFDKAHLSELESRYKPGAVIIEYNPMWKSIRVDESKLPDNWEVYQSITTVDAASFEVYRNNMKSQVSETLKDVDMVLFNRCNADMNLSSYRRSAKALSNGVQIILEHENGTIIPLAEQLPYDLKDPVIQVADDDYGIWYLDAMERPEMYAGKKVSLVGRVAKLHSNEQDWCAIGRQVMTCCADDTQMLGYLCHYEGAGMIERGSWVRVEAEIAIEYKKEYRREGPVLYATRISDAKAPTEEMIYL